MLNKSMPIQSPSWTDFLSCPICYFHFDVNQRRPISLGCGHTLCRLCLTTLHNRQCPFDQTVLPNNCDDLPVNTALMQLLNGNGTNSGAGSSSSSSNATCSNGSSSSNETDKAQQQSATSSSSSTAATSSSSSTNTTTTSSSSSASATTNQPASVRNLIPEDLKSYEHGKKCVENMALHLKPMPGNNNMGSLLSRSMQRKLVSLINCQLILEDGRSRALRSARSLGERMVTELIIHFQNPQQLSSNLWAAVRSRGCQFLGPAMQEEVLKLVLLALEDGSSLSRKVLVMFVVQRLETQYPQASKTSIGHVVQLLYRASCFRVSKRDGDSSLMQLKEEFRTYDALRREHDAQIVQIAMEAGLRIAPDQWSSLLYGDTAHKPHMQSIIRKLQTPSLFAQSVQELFISLQRCGDPSNLQNLQKYLKYLAEFDFENEGALPADWQIVSKVLNATEKVINGFVEFLHKFGNRKIQDCGGAGGGLHGSSTPKYKVSLCHFLTVRGSCPRGSNCTFAHSEEELERYRAKSRRNAKTNQCQNSSSNFQNSIINKNDYRQLNLSPQNSQSLSQTQSTIVSSANTTNTTNSSSVSGSGSANLSTDIDIIKSPKRLASKSMHNSINSNNNNLARDNYQEGLSTRHLVPAIANKSDIHLRPSNSPNPFNNNPSSLCPGSLSMLQGQNQYDLQMNAMNFCVPTYPPRMPTTAGRLSPQQIQQAQISNQLASLLNPSAAYSNIFNQTAAAHLQHVINNNNNNTNNNNLSNSNINPPNFQANLSNDISDNNLQNLQNFKNMYNLSGCDPLKTLTAANAAAAAACAAVVGGFHNEVPLGVGGNGANVSSGTTSPYFDTKSSSAASSSANYNKMWAPPPSIANPWNQQQQQNHQQQQQQFLQQQQQLLQLQHLQQQLQQHQHQQQQQQLQQNQNQNQNHHGNQAFNQLSPRHQHQHQHAAAQQLSQMPQHQQQHPQNCSTQNSISAANNNIDLLSPRNLHNSVFPNVLNALPDPIFYDTNSNAATIDNNDATNVIFSNLNSLKNNNNNNNKNILNNNNNNNNNHNHNHKTTNNHLSNDINQTSTSTLLKAGISSPIANSNAASSISSNPLWNQVQNLCLSETVPWKDNQNSSTLNIMGTTSPFKDRDFVRSDSILDDDTTAPFEDPSTPTLGNKFGPICPMYKGQNNSLVTGVNMIGNMKNKENIGNLISSAASSSRNPESWLSEELSLSTNIIPRPKSDYEKIILMESALNKFHPCASTSSGSRTATSTLSTSTSIPNISKLDPNDGANDFNKLCNGNNSMPNFDFFGGNQKASNYQNTINLITTSHRIWKNPMGDAGSSSKNTAANAAAAMMNNLWMINNNNNLSSSANSPTNGLTTEAIDLLSPVEQQQQQQQKHIREQQLKAQQHNQQQKMSPNQHQQHQYQAKQQQMLQQDHHKQQHKQKQMQMQLLPEQQKKEQERPAAAPKAGAGAAADSARETATGTGKATKTLAPPPSTPPSPPQTTKNSALQEEKQKQKQKQESEPERRDQEQGQEDKQTQNHHQQDDLSNNKSLNDSTTESFESGIDNGKMRDIEIELSEIVDNAWSSADDSGIKLE